MSLDPSSIINGDGELCGGPLLQLFTYVCEELDAIKADLAAANPEGALLANGSVEALGCLSYANDGQVCAEPNSIPSWSQVLDLFVCKDEEVELLGGGVIPYSPPGKLVSVIPFTDGTITGLTVSYNDAANQLVFHDASGPTTAGTRVRFRAFCFLG